MLGEESLNGVKSEWKKEWNLKKGRQKAQTIILNIFPINGYRKTEHQVKGDVSQGKILKYLPVDGNDRVEKIKLVNEMREGIIAEVVMKGN